MAAEKGPAAVRIAMTVAEAGGHEGRLVEIVGEDALDTDNPKLATRETRGRVNADLTVGTNVTHTQPLLSNASIAHDGVKLHGKGFAITQSQAVMLGLGKRSGLERYVRPYRNGKDLAQRNPVAVTTKYIIDFYGLESRDVQSQYPEAADHLLATVYKARDEQVRRSPTNDARAYRDTWWLLGKSRPEMRTALDGLTRYIATVDTAKHRVFQFVDAEVLCDDKLVVIADDLPYTLGVLSSRSHESWAIATGGWLGVGNDSVYVKSRVFDPFPFPDPTPAHRAAIAGIAEELDDTRRRALAEDDGLTMTGLYNLVAAIRDGALAPEQEARATRARARIVAKLHDDLDQAVADAYGWGEEWRAAPLAPADIVARLVALNAERAAEEAAGHVRWLRPDYQIGRSKKGKHKNGDSPP